MKSKQTMCTLRAPGGILDISVLRHTLEWMLGHGGGQVAAGPFQELRLGVYPTSVSTIPAHLHNAIAHGKTQTNVMSSAASLGLTPCTPWLTEGIYREICGSVDSVARIPIAMCDANQALVPHRCGALTFTAYETPSYWQCSVLDSGGDRIDTARAVPMGAIPRLVETFQALFKHGRDDAIAIVDEVCGGSQIEIDRKIGGLWNLGQELAGVHARASDQQGWLCFDLVESLDAKTLLDFVLFVQARGIASIHVTPWRSLLVKGIQSEDMHAWRCLLGRLNISQYPLPFNATRIIGDAPEAMLLWNDIARALRHLKLEAACLPIGICPEPSQGEASLAIRAATAGGTWRSMRYDVRIPEEAAKSLGLIAGAWRGLNRKKVLSICCDIIEHFNECNVRDHDSKPEPARPHNTGDAQCSFCQTVYSSEVGDGVAGIPPGTEFDSLPHDWLCPVCEAPKNSYALVDADES